MLDLITRDWPDYGTPELPPPTTRATLLARLRAVRAAMEARGLTHLVIYGDREHAANIAWTTDFDPRFEEALLIVQRDRIPLLLAGNECYPYTLVSPLVAAADIRRARCASLSLLSQPREGARIADLIAAEISAPARIGTVGWKYWSADEVADPDRAIEIPALIADLLRGIAGTENVVNATDLFMHPAYGLRATIGADEIATFEFANHHAAAGLRRMLFGLCEGVRDFDVVSGAGLNGLPLACHLTFATGARAVQGLSSPTGQTITRGQPLSLNVAYEFANVCRAGWIAEGADDLPEPARDYVEEFAGPYVRALSAWLRSMLPGMPGGTIAGTVARDLPFETFGIFLNPGHLIGRDEWISSPIFPGSEIPLRSGMPMQIDVIPSHPVFGSIRMEEGIVIADEALRAELAVRHPAVSARCSARRTFMQEVIGLDVPESVLPLSDSAGIVPPFLLAPHRMLSLV